MELGKRLKERDLIVCLFVSPDDDRQEEGGQEDLHHSGSHVYIGENPAVTVIPRLLLQTVHDEEEGPSDSDSEGPVLYKEEEDEDEDESHNSKAWDEICLLRCRIGGKEGMGTEEGPGCLCPALYFSHWPTRSPKGLLHPFPATPVQGDVTSNSAGSVITNSQ